MTEQDRLTRIEARLERLEAMVVLLCEEASAGKGMLAAPFWRFVEDWRAEHAAYSPDHSHRDT